MYTALRPRRSVPRVITGLGTALLTRLGGIAVAAAHPVGMPQPAAHRRGVLRGSARMVARPCPTAWASFFCSQLMPIAADGSIKHQTPKRSGREPDAVASRNLDHHTRKRTFQPERLQLSSGCIFADNRPPELADLRVIKAMAGEWQLAMVELQRQLGFSIKAKIHGTHIVRNVHICKRGRDQ
jgi:hypothetical protein